MEQAFAQLDRDGSGFLDLRDIKGKYNARKHPAVIAHQKTEEDVLYEFLHTFESQLIATDYKVSLDEWIEYYTNISASIDDDEYFATMMNNAWNLTKPAPAYQPQPKHWNN